jgi:hypothetical protein
MQIGKFGVGKLAAFALGERLTHIACVNNTVRLVSVGQSEIKEQGQDRRPNFEKYSMPLKKAKPLLETYLSHLPQPWDQKWTTWTLAVIEEIELSAVGRALKVSFLKQMISSSLPISPDFKVYLEGEMIPVKEVDPQNVEVKIDATDSHLRKRMEESLGSHWKDVLEEEREEDVPQDYYKPRVKEVQDPQNEHG